MKTDPLVDLLLSLRVQEGRDRGRPGLTINEGRHWCTWSAVPMPDGKTMIHAAFPTALARVEVADQLTYVDLVLPAGFDVRACPDLDPDAGRDPS